MRGLHISTMGLHISSMGLHISSMGLHARVSLMGLHISDPVVWPIRDVHNNVVSYPFGLLRLREAVALDRS